MALSKSEVKSFEDEMWTEAKKLAAEMKKNQILLTDSDIATMIWTRLALSERGRAYKLYVKEQENFKELEAEFKRKQSKESASDEGEENVPKKKSKNSKKNNKKKVSKVVPSQNDEIDSDDDSVITSDSDNDDN